MNGINGGGSAQLKRFFPALGERLTEDDAHALQLCGHDMQHPHRSAADHQHIITKAQLRSFDAVDHTGKRLCERHILKAGILRIDVEIARLCRNVFGKALIARDTIRLLEGLCLWKILTDIFLTALAVMACFAVVNNILHNLLPDGKALRVHRTAKTLDRTAVLMTADARIGIAAVSAKIPHVVCADPRRVNADEHLIRLRLRRWNLLYGKIPRPLQNDCLHRLDSSFLRRSESP